MHRRSAWAALITGLAMLAAGPALAGGADLEALEGDTENGVPFFGEATDVKGMKPMANVRIRAQVKGQPLPVFAYTNDEGRFSIRGFGKGVDPANVDVQCDADGFSLIDLTRRRVSAKVEAPVVVECLFEKR